MALKKRLASFFVLLLLLSDGAAWAASNSDDADFICGGKLESAVWQLWDSSAKEYLRTQQFSKRLKEQGDAYALYDVQTYTHNLVAMAQRCQRMDRLEELAEVFGVAFASLETAPEGKAGLAWVCKGGAVCNDKNRLIHHEVVLDSIQFLGLTVSVANSLARAPKQPQSKFVEQTAITSIQHLLRFADTNEMQLLDKQLAAQAQDAKDGSSGMLFTDRPLWMIAIYADLAGILQNNPTLGIDVKLTEDQPQGMRAHLSKLLKLFAARITLVDAVGRDGRAVKLTEDQLQGMRAHLSKLLKLFAARITLMDGVGRDGRPVKLAEIDRGYWRLFADNRYAGYSGSEKPVTCIPQPDGKFQKKVSLDAATLGPVSNIGWDISHARRLVHAFDAIERNRNALQKVFGIASTDLPSTEIMTAFAQQLVVHVWNGDAGFPLFANYWSGANGWYRVGYDNGTPGCVEGYPPFGLTDSFATGGYASWARYVPEIRPLGRRLYRLSVSNVESDRLFMDKYYPKLGAKANAGNRMLTQLMFWPSLVEAAQ